MNKLKMGILSTGNIAHQMAETVVQMDNVELYAVASRSMEKAKSFAEEFDIPKAYDSYEALVQNPDVDLVYIGTPHRFHYENTMLALQHKKPVLCEKPFAINLNEAEEMIRYAREKNVFLCEAMWVRFQPLAKKIRELIDEGAVGAPRLVLANKGELNNLGQSDIDPAVGGSALLGNGVYSITCAAMAFGDDVTGFSTDVLMLDSGTDGANTVTLHYSDGKMAALTSSIIANEHNAWYVCGDEGFMEIRGLSRLKTIRIFNNKREETAFIEAPPMISGYEFEVEACCEAIREGKIETEIMPHKETLRVMKLMDDIRKKWGLKFPFEV